MLCLNRKFGEGILIDNKYLLLIGIAIGDFIESDLYYKEKFFKNCKLFLKQPYELVKEVYVTFLGTHPYYGLKFGLTAPKSINIVRPELLLKERYHEKR